jgi:5-(carboxyamino)imidazole ribonucleotide mutase
MPLFRRGRGSVIGVSVILGSDSDREIFKSIASTLMELGIGFEKRIISAHRTPDILKSYVEDAEDRGVGVFIAVAGMAAALPGVISSITTLPVIGVPVAFGSATWGLDALLSMVQMPPGVPVATVALNGGKNAALLAAHMLALTDADLKERVMQYRKKQRQKVVDADALFSRE